MSHSFRFLFFFIQMLVLCILTSSVYAGELTLYVSPEGNDTWQGASLDKPLKTIQKARDIIRQMKKEGKINAPVTVFIRGGVYELSQPLLFTLEDSGSDSCPITYTAYKNEKPVISGGRKISGPWRSYKDNIMVCTIEEVKNGKWKFNELFLKGERQQRARTPNEGYYRAVLSKEETDKSSFKFREGDFKNWKNVNDIEVVVFHLWNESRLRVSEIDADQNIVRFTGPIGAEVGRGNHRNRYYIENILEGLDQPGEWYLDAHTGELYYWQPATESQAPDLRAPVINELVRFEGNLKEKQYVQYVKIQGLTFSDAGWMLPEKGIPTISDVGDIWFPSAITLNGVSNCVFENNCIRNVGTYGLEITGDGNKIIGNEIYDAGSGGIITRSYGKEPNVISYNHIHHCGKVLHSGVGINIDDGGGVISHNLIHHTTHSGIYGRHWATDYGQEQERRNQEQGLVIEYNEIYDVMHEMNDGAGIFIRDDFIKIRNNLIHDVYSNPEGAGSPAWGIYLGCETRNCLVENNVVYRARAGQLVWYHNRNNTIVNNIFVDGDLNQLGRRFAQINYQSPSDLKHQDIKFLRNIIYFSKPDAVLFNLSGEHAVPVESDYNVIYHTQGKELVIEGLKGTDSFKAWQKRGFDAHSLIADPLFVDPAKDDYSLKPESPALKLGFKPIDISTVGLRGKK